MLLGLLRVLALKCLLILPCGPSRTARSSLFSGRSNPGFDASCAVVIALIFGCRILRALSESLLS